MNLSVVLSMLRRTEILRSPQRRLSSFGETRVRYHLVSPVEDMSDRSRLREGLVVAQRPKILTPEHLRERFQGFDEDSRRFGEWLLEATGEALRALEYRFKNEPTGARVVHSPVRELSARLQKDLAEAPDAAVILCPDAGWQAALLKFLLDESRKSFGGNVGDLERRGAFRGPEERRHAQIEALFRKARADRSAVGELADKLKEYGLFAEYEDRFFSLLD